MPNTQTNNDITHEDILGAINTFATHVEHRFQRIEDKIGTIETKMGRMETKIGTIETKMGRMENDITKIQATMVTKDYLDDRLADLRGDLVILTRKEDKKLIALIQELQTRGVLPEKAARRILKMEPFPQLLL